MSNVFVSGWWDRLNFCKLTDDTKLGRRAGRLSEPGDVQNLTGEGSEQPDQTLELALVWAGVGPDDLQRPLRTYVIPWFYIQHLCKKHMLYIHNKSLFLLSNVQLHGRDRAAQGPSSTETVLLCEQVCKIYNFKHVYSIAYMCRVFPSLNHKVILFLTEIMNHKRCH